MAAFAGLSDSWTAREVRRLRQSRTAIVGHAGQQTQASSTVKLKVSNIGDVPISQFANWDLIFEIQREPGLGIAYLEYVSSTPLSLNQWTVDGIYRDADIPLAETLDPGVLNPGEEMVVLTKPDPPVKEGTYDRAIFATPSGAKAEVVIRILE